MGLAAAATESGLGYLCAREQLVQEGLVKDVGSSSSGCSSNGTCPKRENPFTWLVHPFQKAFPERRFIPGSFLLGSSPFNGAFILD